MNISKYLAFLFLFSCLPFTPLQSQISLDDYQRADTIRRHYADITHYNRLNINWIDSTSLLWYSVNAPEGTLFYKVDADLVKKELAFNHEKLASVLSTALDEELNPYELPIRSLNFEGGKKLFFTSGRKKFACDLRKYTLELIEEMPERSRNADYWGNARDELANQPTLSPDSTLEAFIQDYDVWIRDRKTKKTTRLSWDGSEGHYYSSYMYWSPDSKKLLANKYLPGYTRMVHYIESSPDDQLQPRHSEVQYTKPGDRLPQLNPAIFLVTEHKQIVLKDDLFQDQFDLGRFQWREDSKAVSFEYNQRGHQVYRIIEASVDNPQPQVIIDEQCETFFHYSGKRYRKDLNDGEEIIWASERDGWNHLYLYDGKTGQVKNQITKGDWLVRNVRWVDEDNRRILFEASGREAGDPYFIHLYQINFDGSGLKHLTPKSGNHSISFSDEYDYFTDTWSMVDQAPQTVLRRTSDGSELLMLEQADISLLKEAGWKPAEVYAAKGRDGETDIWGIIVRPSNFDPTKSYPVIEYIYAGPHSSHVPKTFRPDLGMQSLAELGFIVVQCDGMGTSNRSKAFHDVCWQNLGDAGFPDRIAWMKAAARQYPYMNIDKVGIYGTSAGGQNATGAVLFHPEFYDVAVSSCGCHDNRMDKIWWNEQWMGYPIGPHYGASSNVDNAYRLKGKLFLIVGEMDKNVDPSSTMQVVDALIKAEKNFDLLVVPGMGHSGGGKFGERKRRDFFVKHLLGVDPPDWNRL